MGKSRKNKSKTRQQPNLQTSNPSPTSQTILHSKDDSHTSKDPFSNPRLNDQPLPQSTMSDTKQPKKRAKSAANKSVPSFMQQTGASKMGSTAMLSDAPDALFYTSHELTKPKSKQLSPLSNLTRLEVANHLAAPRAQFAFLEDIKRYRVEKGKAKLKALNTTLPNAVDPNVGRKLPTLPTDEKPVVGAGSGAGTNQ